jgi:hypothetical protein
LSILYEIEHIGRFPRVQEYLSYGRLVKPTQESAGKVLGHSGRRIGNAHLKWAYSEAAVCFLRANPRGGGTALSAGHPSPACADARQ